MIRHDQAGSAIIVPLPDEIDLTNCEQVYDRLSAAFARGVVVVIADFTATWFCDCGSLRRLLTLQQQAPSRGGQLRLVIPPGSLVRRVADLTGLDRGLHFYSTTQEATARISQPADSLRGGVSGAVDPA
jgi:anti-anti-sigma factor